MMNKEVKTKVKKQHREDDQPAWNVVDKKPGSVLNKKAVGASEAIANELETKDPIKEGKEPRKDPENPSVAFDPS